MQQPIKNVNIWLEKAESEIKRLSEKARNVPFAGELRFTQPESLFLATWPMLWGLFSTSAFPLLKLPLIIALAMALRAGALIYSDLTDNNREVEDLENGSEDTIDEKDEKSLWVLLFALTLGALWISAMMSASTLFATMIGGVLIIAYPYLSRISWWPQIITGILFGAWPLLIGQAASGNLNFSVIPLMFAGFLWVCALETLRAGTSFDPKGKLSIISDILGDKKVNYSQIFMGSTLVILILNGLILSANGLYYAGLMLAQGVMMSAFLKAQKNGNIENSYRYTTLSALCTTLAFALS